MVFEGPRTIRTLAAGPEFANDPKKTVWNLTELFKAVQVANRAANMARAVGLKYVVENAFEALKGDGVTRFGSSEFFANVNSNMFLQCDTANFFATSRVVTKPEEAKAFMEKYASRMPYIHIKASSSEHKVLPVLAQNELDFDTVFMLAAEGGAEDITQEDDMIEIVAPVEDFKSTLDQLRPEDGENTVLTMRLGVLAQQLDAEGWFQN